MLTRGGMGKGRTYLVNLGRDGKKKGIFCKPGEEWEKEGNVLYLGRDGKMKGIFCKPGDEWEKGRFRNILDSYSMLSQRESCGILYWVMN